MDSNGDDYVQDRLEVGCETGSQAFEDRMDRQCDHQDERSHVGAAAGVSLLIVHGCSQHARMIRFVVEIQSQSFL